MVRAFHLLDVVEAAHRHGVRSIRQAAQHARHHQADIARVVGVAKGFPFDVLGAVEVVADILDGGNLFHGLFQKEGRADGADKRHMGRGGDAGDVAQQRHVLRAGVELIRGDHRANRLAARGVVLGGVGVPVEAALNQLRRVFEVLAQVVFGDVQNFGFDVLAVVGAVHQLLQAAPQGFHLLELRMVHHRVQLAADLIVQFSDMVVNQGLVELLHGLSGLTDAVHKHLHRRRQSFARRGVGQRGIIQKVVNIAQAGSRGQVDFVKQGGVNALFFQYSGLPLRGGGFSIYRHQHIPG